METRRANLSEAMQWLESGYSMRFNRRHRRSGHLFQARFGAVVLEPAEAALEVSRYLHLNPIRVRRWGMSKAEEHRRRRGFAAPASREAMAARLRELRHYRWSSYRAYVGLETAPAWLSCKAFLKRLGMDARSYQRYVEQEIREGHIKSPWECLQGQVLLGTNAFVERLRNRFVGRQREQPSLRLLERRASWEHIVAVVEKLKSQPWPEFRDRHGDWGRDLVLWLAWKHGGMTLNQLGEKVGGLDYTSVSMALKRFRERCHRDQHLTAVLQRAQSQL